MIKKNPDYWDCECGSDYIHHISEKECPLCGCHEEDQPESRQVEIDYHNNLKAVDGIISYLATEPRDEAGLSIAYHLRAELYNHFKHQQEREL